MNYKEKMSQIGEVMDELVKRGFENMQNYLGILIIPKHMISFECDEVRVFKRMKETHSISYNNPNWQKELLDEADELMED